MCTTLMNALRSLTCKTYDNILDIVNPKINDVLQLIRKIEGLLEKFDRLVSHGNSNDGRLSQELELFKPSIHASQLRREAEKAVAAASSVVEFNTPISALDSNSSEPIRYDVSSHVCERSQRDEDLRSRTSFVKKLHREHSLRLKPELLEELSERDNYASVREWLAWKPSEDIPSSDWSENPSDDKIVGADDGLSMNSKQDYSTASPEVLLLTLGFSSDLKGSELGDALLKVSQLEARGPIPYQENITKTIQYLIEKGANVDQRDIGGETALFWASRIGNTQSVKYLCGKSADILAQENCSHTALHTAAQKGHPSVIDVLLNQAAKMDRRATHSSGNPDLLVFESDQMGTVESLLHSTTNIGSTALHHAARHQHVYCAKLLVEAGVPLDNVNNAGHTALVEAIVGGCDTLVSLLIEGGANVSLEGTYEETPLHMASLECHNAQISALLKVDAPIDARDEKGLTPFMLTAMSGNTEGIDLFIAWGADIKARALNDYTALHLMISSESFAIELKHHKECDCRICLGLVSRKQIVQQLCENGADVSAETETLARPIDLLSNAAHINPDEKKAIRCLLQIFDPKELSIGQNAESSVKSTEPISKSSALKVTKGHSSPTPCLYEGALNVGGRASTPQRSGQSGSQALRDSSTVVSIPDTRTAPSSSYSKHLNAVAKSTQPRSTPNPSLPMKTPTPNAKSEFNGRVETQVPGIFTRAAYLSNKTPHKNKRSSSAKFMNYPIQQTTPSTTPDQP